MMSNLSPSHVLDMLFYNFYDLDRYNRAALGDEVLMMGRRDPLQQYIHQKHLRETLGNLDGIADDLKRDVELLQQTDETRIKAILAKAIQLAAMADYIKEKKFVSENERKEFILKYESARLAYAAKYGDIGRIISEALRDKKDRKNWVFDNTGGNRKPNVYDPSGKNKLVNKDTNNQGMSSNDNIREPIEKGRRYSEADHLDIKKNINKREDRAPSSTNADDKNNQPGILNNNRINRVSSAIEKTNTPRFANNKYSEEEKSGLSVGSVY